MVPAVPPRPPVPAPLPDDPPDPPVPALPPAPPDPEAPPSASPLPAAPPSPLPASAAPPPPEQAANSSATLPMIAPLFSLKSEVGLMIDFNSSTDGDEEDGARAAQRTDVARERARHRRTSTRLSRAV